MTTDLTKVRGIANNNPGNIDRSEPRWNGEVRRSNGGWISNGQPYDDAKLSAQQKWELTQGRFAVFQEPHDGIRALVMNIKAHITKVGHDTIRKLIAGTPQFSGWAPAKDGNDPEAYIAAVVKYSG